MIEITSQTTIQAQSVPAGNSMEARYVEFLGVKKKTTKKKGMLSRVIHQKM